MFEANTTNLVTGYSGAISTGGYSGTSITTITDGSGLTLQGNSTLNYSNPISNNMTPTKKKTRGKRRLRKKGK